MNIAQALKAHKKEIDREIKKYLDQELAQMDVDTQIQRVMEHARDSILAGGKRIRPIMMLYGYKAAGGMDTGALLRAAIGIELIHAFLLMHDDVIDQDDFRHGVPTMHAFAREGLTHLKGEYDNTHYGESIAIVVGDLLYSLGNKAIFTSNFASEHIIQALIALQEIVAHTVIGEMQDVNFETQNHVTESDIMGMYENKTARYTFEGPLRLGTILAGNEGAMSGAMTQYALSMGRAFQLQDDLLGVFGESKKTGKPVGSDIAEGKMTILLQRAYAQATDEDGAILDRIVGKSNLTEDEVKEVQEVMQRSGAYEYVSTYSEREISQARHSLEQCTHSGDVFDFLDGLAQYLQNREV